MLVPVLLGEVVPLAQPEAVVVVERVELLHPPRGVVVGELRSLGDSFRLRDVGHPLLPGLVAVGVESRGSPPPSRLR